MTLHNVNNYQF